MDETTIYLDCPSRYTYENRGVKRVKIDTNGAELVRISAIYTASADGEKLPIFLLVPRTKDLENYEPPYNVKLIYKTGGTFNDDTICDYLLAILGERRRSTLYLDSARCHITAKVKDRFNQLGLESFYIPPRMTNLLQPADVCWFAKIKKAYCTKWAEWSRNREKNYTMHGNSKSPGYVLAISWLSEIWENFEEHLIQNSFDYCVITAQNQLHKTLSELVSKNLVFNSYVDNLEEEDTIMGFSNEDANDDNLLEENFAGLSLTNRINDDYEMEQDSPQPTTQQSNLEFANSIQKYTAAAINNSNRQSTVQQVDISKQANIQTTTEIESSRQSSNSSETN
ncbi:unnamed protein product, partial [Brachionus calyciflorus]